MRLTAIRFLLLGAALAAPGSHAQENAIPVDLELVIAVDASGSMDRSEIRLQRHGYSQAIVHPDFVAAIGAGEHARIAVTYVEWSGVRSQQVLVPWRLIDDAERARAFAAELESRPFARGRGTSISAALAFGARLFGENAYAAGRRVIDVSGDGPNNYGAPVAAARDALVADGIVVNGLPILIEPSPIFPAMDRYYSACVIGGPGAFMLPVRAAGEFALAIRRKLILEVAARPAAALIPVGAEAPVDCLVGERARERHADPYFPGLDQ